MNKLLTQALKIPGTNGSIDLEYPNNLKPIEQFNNIGSIISKAVPLVFAIAGIGLLIMIIAAGLKLMTSAGDAKQMEAGRQQLTYAVVGFIIIFASYWIVQILGIVTGIGFGSVFK